jgi:hypothetical protein
MEISPHIAISIVSAAVAVAALVCLLQLRGAQREMQIRWNKRLQSVQAEVGTLRGKVDQMRSRIEEADQRATLLSSPATPKDGLNLARRTQALRLLRKGERPEQIASALNMPVGEAVLLAKVQQILHTEARAPLDSTPTGAMPATPPEEAGRIDREFSLAVNHRPA